MQTINLKQYYPFCTEDTFVEVSDEIAVTLSIGGRCCDSYKRRKREHGECSLDAVPGFEADVSRPPLTPEEKAACQKVRDTLGTQFCRRCNYCAPCTVGIQIPSCFLFHGYLERYGLAGWAHERYDTLTVKAGACIGCGKCETRCPYNLPIRDMLKKVAQDFGE